MSVRTSISTSAQSSPGSTERSVTGRAMIIGRAAQGPIVPTLVAGPADFVAKFGSRSATNQDLHDCVMSHFASGGIPPYIVRAVGATPVQASAALTSTNTLTLTAREYGTGPNAFTASYDSATKTVTIIANGGTEQWSGADAATLVANVNGGSAFVTAVCTTLPVANVASTAFTSGADDFATAKLTAALALLPASFGPGVILVPGVAHSENFANEGSATGPVLAAHCASLTGRTALVSHPSSINTYAAWKTDLAVVAAYSNAHLLGPVWPRVTMPLSTGSSVVTVTGLDPVGVASGRRAAAHAIGPWVSPLRDSLRNVPGVTDLVVNITDVQALEAFGLGGIILRKLTKPTETVVQIAGWKSAAAPSGDVKKVLQGFQFRDLVAAIAYEAALIGDSREGVTIDGKGIEIGTFDGFLRAMCDKYASKGALFEKGTEPAYSVDTSSSVNTTESLAAGLVKAAIRLRLSPVAEFVVINITAGDAGLVL